MAPLRLWLDGLMEGWDAGGYGDAWAEIYDEVWAGRFDVGASVELLAELARGGPALELGVGTGRLALPLSERGVKVHGIDNAEPMVAKLRAKPGGENVPVTVGDFADVPVEATYRLVFVVFNTLFALPTQAEQVRCFRNVADHLADGGAFLVEAFVPDLTRFTRHQNVEAEEVAAGEVALVAARHDPVAQQVFAQRLVLTPEGTRMYPVRIRYAFPSELDLMAELAGLQLRARYGGWRKEPLTVDHQGHVSIYEKR